MATMGRDVYLRFSGLCCRVDQTVKNKYLTSQVYRCRVAQTVKN